MIKNEKIFCVKEYVRAFEKSLNYMFWSIFSIAITLMISYIVKCTLSDKWFITIWKLLKNILDGTNNFLLIRILLIIAAVLTTLPYYFYYTLKDNSDWNAYGGKRDIWGLKKIYLLYEISVMGLFYLLLMRRGQYSADKFIVALAGALFTIVYIVLSLYRQRRESSIGYFFILILMALIFFMTLGISNFLQPEFKIDAVDEITVYMLLLLANSTINIFFLHKFDSCKESGIIANRIKIIIPMLSLSIYAPILTYCYYYSGIWNTNSIKIEKANEYIICMLIAAIWITVYEILISCIRLYDSSRKILCCVLSFIIFVMGMTIIIKRFVLETVQNELIQNWFLMIGVCIYLVSVKYFSSITKLQQQHLVTTKLKAKITNAVIWFRSSLLGSVLLILVILITEKAQFLLLITMITSFLLLEYFVYRYVFHPSTKDTSQKVYVIGKLFEFLAIVLPLIAFLIEITERIDWGKHMPQEPAIFVIVEATCLLVIIAALLFLIVRLDQGRWIRISEPNKEEVLREVWNRLRNIKKLTTSVLLDKNVKNFWMAVITWATFIFLSFTAIMVFPAFLQTYTGSDEQGIGFTYRFAGFLLIAFIIEVDWLLVSRDLFNYYLEKMKEGTTVMAYRKNLIEEWEKCLEDLSEYKQSDAAQLKYGSYYRTILFLFGAAYQNRAFKEQKVYHAAVKASCSIELLHKSTILIDDYLDRDVIRGGQPTYHMEYPDSNTMFLLRNALQAKALMNFAECKENFLCNDDVAIKNMDKLSHMIYDNTLGHYRESMLQSYAFLDRAEIDEINQMEMVTLFKNSIELGYSCFHKEQGYIEHGNLSKMGEMFGQFYQYMNDLEPFTQKNRRKKKDSTIVDYFGRKSIVLLTLYAHLTEEEKKRYDNTDVKTIEKLYKEYGIEQEILNEMTDMIQKMRNTLLSLAEGNDNWVKNFKAMFNHLVWDRGWHEKLEEL